MIIIYNGERQIYHPQNPNLKLVSPKLTLEDNAAGSLTFKVYDSNLNYNTIKKLHPVVSVIRDGKTLFKGRVISDKKDFYNGKSVEVEGKLAFFNDSYMEPFSFSGRPEELFRMVVENHNSQVMGWQQFKVGVVTVVDPNDYIVRSSENVINSWNALKDKCFKSSLGGHIRIRYEKDGDYIDWLADYDVISKQSIEFAKNMIDMSLEVDATETYTAIRPIGAEVDGVKIDISSVNDGKTYIINEEKAAEYGIIFAPESESIWEDVMLPQNLFKKAKEKLFGSFITLNETYEIKAVDLHLTDENIEALNICEYVPVVSRPHGIRGNYLLSKADICITEPQNSVFYLGSSKRVFSDMNIGGTTVVQVPKSISSFENDAGYISEEKTEEILSEYTKTEDVKEIVSQAVSQIPSGENGLSAYEIAVVYGFSGTEEEWLDSLKGKDAEGDYLPLTGGTLKSTDFYPLTLQQSKEDSAGCGLLFKNKNGIVGNLQFVSDSQSYAEARFFIRKPDGKYLNVFNVSEERRKIYHSETQKLQEIITDYEFSELSKMLNGFSFGYTEDGKPGFKEPGETEYKPLIGSVSSGEAPDPDNQSKIYRFNWKHGGQYNARTTSYTGQFGFCPLEIKSITVNGQMAGKKTSAGSNATHALYLKGTKIGSVSDENIQLISSVSVSSTTNTIKEIKDYVVNVDEDIDWTVWDKNKPILLYYHVNAQYHVGDINLNIELQSRGDSELNVKQATRGYNYSGLQFSKLTFLDPETISKIHLQGSLKAFDQSAYLYELGCTKGSSAFVNIVNLSTVSAGATLNVDKDYTPVDWNTYDPEKGLMFSMYPMSNSTKPGGLTGEINYTIK